MPPEQRAFALDAIDAVLAQSLYLDGGRYATPYAFVRALKKRAVKAALPVRDSTVRLLTVHGAKGLEADTVFVMDTEPERVNPATTTLLVEWPVDSPRPTRCAFVYNENRCPYSLRSALDDELRAREREELNMLYVAMSRAKRRLVFSATEPYQATDRSARGGAASARRARLAAAASAELLFDCPAPSPQQLPAARGHPDRDAARRGARSCERRPAPARHGRASGEPRASAGRRRRSSAIVADALDRSARRRATTDRQRASRGVGAGQAGRASWLGDRRPSRRRPLLRGARSSGAATRSA